MGNMAVNCINISANATGMRQKLPVEYKINIMVIILIISNMHYNDILALKDATY